jgi:hypothetical protein
MIRFDTDTPGEPKMYFEPDSDANFSLTTGGGAAAAGIDIGFYVPIENVMVLDIPPSDTMRID